MVILPSVIKDSLLFKLKFKLEFDFHLVTEIIVLEASGISESPPSSFNPSVGESLHLSSF